MKIDTQLKPADLRPAIDRVFGIAADKVRLLERAWDTSKGTPVFTVNGKYTTRGWTEWTQGFQYGCAILTFDATDDCELLELGRQHTLKDMAPHVTHIGVHDHGFNNLSTYGNLRRLMHEGRFEHNEWENHFYEMAIKASGAVQAARWTETIDARTGSPKDGGGFIYSFNGPQSLFIDTMRTIRILGAAHQLGHALMGEQDTRHNLLGRSIQHALTTSKYIVFHGDSEHTYDVRGRTAHEGLFNRNDGRFRARSTQQGYSPFSTWTRGLSWAVCGYPEQLEFLKTLKPADIKAASGLAKGDVIALYEQAARDVCDHYIDDVSTTDGITYWDDGAPNLHKLGDWRNAPADPYNDHEPVDATASAIAAQGLIRFGQYLGKAKGKRYLQAGLSVARTLFDEPYLSTKKNHQGMLLHSIYHWPNGWDNVPRGRKVACDESSMWGDYHLLELANLIKRMANDAPYPVFFDKA
ncbi:glycosyl hydrolase [Phycisphaerales bacterium AB-hyl4]|uniref:Glycosyl hydrolase n=1 Tax=Natronomicrosphaera hydrolytica TaxID=3242702 RepID=A0ABV4U4L7_9BACT